MNASTTDPNSTVEQSALTRDRVEDLMVDQESHFKEKQEEQARLLDELAGKLQSLDLSAAAEMVRLGIWSHFLWSHRRLRKQKLVFDTAFANLQGDSSAQGTGLQCGLAISSHGEHEYLLLACSCL